MSADDTLSRRRVLGGLAATGVVALAGCSGPEDDDGATDDDPDENEQEDESDNALGGPAPDGGSARG